MRFFWDWVRWLIYVLAYTWWEGEEEYVCCTKPSFLHGLEPVGQVHEAIKSGTCLCHIWLSGRPCPLKSVAVQLASITHDCSGCVGHTIRFETLSQQDQQNWHCCPGHRRLDPHNILKHALGINSGVTRTRTHTHVFHRKSSDHTLLDYRKHDHEGNNRN